MDYKRSLYNIGLNGNGYLLTNIARKRPRIMSQSSVFGTRFAQGDRSYLDFNLWWYWAQSEWSNGFKDKVSWSDDGKYYFSSNIDAYSKVGSFKLLPNVSLVNTFTENIYCGLYSQSAIGIYNNFIGTNDDTGGKPRIYGYNGATWDNLADAQMTINQNIISHLISSNSILWSSSIGVGTTNVVLTYDGSSFTDQSGYINSTLSYQALSSPCMLFDGFSNYVAVDNFINKYIAIVKTSVSNPTQNSDWSKLLSMNSTGRILDMCMYGGNLYYLLSYTNGADLMVTDPITANPTLVRTFKSTNFPFWGVGGRLLFSYQGKLIITVPSNNIWSWDGSNMNRIFLQDNSKALLGVESSAYLTQGGVLSKDRLHWGNLVYDGTNFFYNNKDAVESNQYQYFPIFSDVNDNINGISSSNINKLYIDSGYKGTAGKNFLVFNQNDIIPTIDKIFHHATFNFNYLASGESIIIEYLLSDLTPTSNVSWTSLGSATFANDGGTINNKTIYFPDNTVGKKMWLRVKLEGSGSTTPTFNDIAIAYLPMPDLKHDWTLYLECYDNMMLLDGKTKETKRGEELKSLLKFNWWGKTAMDFQDIDYAETLLNGAITDPTATTITVDSTLDFSQQGRLRIEQEEILYTSKNATSFIGCTRGARGSLATTHADNTLVATNYKVIIQSLEEFTPELQNIKVKNEESVVVLSLREL